MGTGITNWCRDEVGNSISITVLSVRATSRWAAGAGLPRARKAAAALSPEHPPAVLRGAPPALRLARTAAGSRTRPSPPTSGCLRERAKSYAKPVPPQVSRSKHSGLGGEDLLALLTQLALGSDVPVERHRPDAEFSAQFEHRRVAVGHRGLSQPHLGFRQRELPAALYRGSGGRLQGCPAGRPSPPAAPVRRRARPARRSVNRGEGARRRGQRHGRRLAVWWPGAPGPSSGADRTSSSRTSSDAPTAVRSTVQVAHVAAGQQLASATRRRAASPGRGRHRARPRARR